MKLLEQIAEYLETQDVGTRGTDLFINSLPGDKDDIVGIFQTGGDPDREIPVREYRIQIMVRSKKMKTGGDKAYVIYDLFKKKNDAFVLKVGGIDIRYVFAVQEPTFIGKDDTDRHLFSCNYIFGTKEL